MCLFDCENIVFKNFKKIYSINNINYFNIVLFIHGLFFVNVCLLLNELDFKIESEKVLRY